MTLPVYLGPQLFQADAEPSRNRPHRGPGRGNLAALNPAVGPERQVSRLADLFLRHVAGFA
jgi:hypothetical protein